MSMNNFKYYYILAYILILEILQMIRGSYMKFDVENLMLSCLSTDFGANSQQDEMGRGRLLERGSGPFRT